MAIAVTTRTVSDGFLSVGRLTENTTNAFAKLVAWNATRVTRASLSKLTDRELEDIGLSRGDINNI